MFCDISNNIISKMSHSKKIRKHNAIKLPIELNNIQLPKYVVYYKECYNREKLLYREFFKIEKHPYLLNKNINCTSSKSNKITILEKLREIEEKLNNLDKLYNNNNNNNNIENTSNSRDLSDVIILPKYISLKILSDCENKYYFVYDKKICNTRENYKCVYFNNHSINENLANFLLKIKEKYT